MTESCFICGDTFELDNSHDIPKYIGGTKKDGIRKLCKKHHREYDLYLLIKFLKSINEYHKIKDWSDVKKWQIEIKKHHYLHPKFQKITKEILKYYFYNYIENENLDNYFCIVCGQEIDIEDYMFRNFCEKCFNSQDAYKEVLD